MPFDDLDLEFEDEEDPKKKKSDAVQVDVDLEFHSSEAHKAKLQAQASRPVGPGTSPSISKPQPKIAIVQKPEDSRVLAAPAKKPVSNTAPQISGTSALKEEPVYDLESDQVVQLREQLKKVEFEAAVKVAVAEFKMEMMAELLGDVKLMEHQIGQLLVRINVKHPDMKQEALMIKKILADFTAKKRK